ncbi:MAG: methyltransferase domain-containing protein [Thermodesulfobacteriota bacterium]
MSDYSIVAPFYDWILYPFMRGIRRDVLGMVKQIKPGRIIDVCCGTGDQLRLLKRNNIDAIGIDLSDAMLRVAQKGKGPVRCLMQDATAMALRDQSFDLAMVSFALHETEWEKALSILQEIHRILKPSGNLLIVDYALNPNSSVIAKAAIHAIEFLAGKRHFHNFLQYNRNGGLVKMIDPHRFIPIEDRFHGQRSLVVRLLRKI